MRGIKFRAWDRKNGIMFYPTSVIFNEYGLVNIIRNGGHNTGDQSLYGADFLLMESMDLKDKNGKEIHEGDIINQEFNDNSIRIAIVEENKSCKLFGFDIKFKNIPNNISWDYKSEKLEIIGNIHDNPELWK